ncbi:MAG: NADH-quinone oxidoreductase subunit NuoE [Chloroflexota bacterium]|nr:NADH-quinone oxidoreductase subunit NuoE [Chloroflexota bacterium]
MMTGPLSAATEERIRAEVRKFAPHTRTALLPSLKIAQEEQHYLSPEAIARVAELVGVSHAAANELSTFYSMLHKEPLGRKVVEVCVQLPCALRGADELLQKLADALGIQPGQTTADGEVTLMRTHECFGACHRAPMCLVNHEYREGLRGEPLEQLLRELLPPVPAGVPSPSGREAMPRSGSAEA